MVSRKQSKESVQIWNILVCNMPLNVFTAILLMHPIAILFLATQTDNNNNQYIYAIYTQKSNNNTG